VIVDASTNEEIKKYMRNLANAHARFEVIYEKQVKEGTSSARNIGAEKCSGNVVIFLDDDVMLDERYIEEVLGTYANDRKGRVGGVTGAVLRDKSRGKYLKELPAQTQNGFESIGFGMWAGRDDMEDSAQWVRRLREQEWNR